MQDNMTDEEREALKSGWTRDALVRDALAKLTVAEYAAITDHVIASFLAEVVEVPESVVIGLSVIASVVEGQPSIFGPLGCANPWHQTAPARERQYCPECPR